MDLQEDNDAENLTRNYRQNPTFTNLLSMVEGPKRFPARTAPASRRLVTPKTKATQNFGRAQRAWMKPKPDLIISTWKHPRLLLEKTDSQEEHDRSHRARMNALADEFNKLGVAAEPPGLHEDLRSGSTTRREDEREPGTTDAAGQGPGIPKVARKDIEDSLGKAFEAKVTVQKVQSPATPATTSRTWTSVTMSLEENMQVLQEFRIETVKMLLKPTSQLWTRPAKNQNHPLRGRPRMS